MTDGFAMVRAFERHFARALKDRSVGSGWRTRALFAYAEREAWFAQAAAWPGSDGWLGFEFRMKPMALDPLWWEVHGQAEDADRLAARLSGSACPAPLLRSERHDWTGASPLDMADRFLDFAEKSAAAETARLGGRPFSEVVAAVEGADEAGPARLVALLAEERFAEARSLIAARGPRDETFEGAKAWLDRRSRSSRERQA